MKRTRINPDLSLFPEALHPFFSGASVYDSSSSPEESMWAWNSLPTR